MKGEPAMNGHACRTEEGVMFMKLPADVLQRLLKSIDTVEFGPKYITIKDDVVYSYGDIRIYLWRGTKIERATSAS